MVDISGLHLSRESRQPGSLTTWELMKLAKRWLVWKYGPISVPGKKAPKQPFYLNGQPRGATDTADDVSQLGSYDVALKKVQAGGGILHLGFALGPDGAGGSWQGHDNDADPNLTELDDAMPGYIERSPSKNGWHCVSYGRPFAPKVDHDKGHEWYSQSRYFSVTQDLVRDREPGDLYDLVGTGPPPDHHDLPDRPVETLSEGQLRDLKAALKYLDSNPYSVWVAVALALQKVQGGLEIFLEWSRTSPKHTDQEAIKKFNNTGLPFAPFRSIFSWAKEAGWDPKEVPGFDLLARALPVDFGIGQPVEFVLDDFIATGTVVVAGAPGVGKSSILMGITLSVAHLAEVPGLPWPYLRRRIAFITEDPSQIRRIIRGTYLKGQIKVKREEFNTWFKLIPSNRAQPEAWRKALADMMKADETDPYIPAGGFRPAPVIVFDTVPSNLEIKDENDNAAASAAIAAIRAGAGNASIFAVTHTAKAQRFADPEEMSARGASAWAGDTQGEVMIAMPQKEDPDDPPPEHRLVLLGKRRFEARHVLYEVKTETSEELTTTPWGQEQTILYRTVSSFAPKTLEQRSEEKKEKRGGRREDDERAALMICVGRFKKALAAAPGRGLAVSHARGQQPTLAAGWERLLWNDIIRGVAGNGGGMRARVIDAILEACKPADDGSYYYFEKPSFGIGGIADNKGDHDGTPAG